MLPNPETNKRITELDERIQEEQDPQRFIELVGELNRVLDDDGRTAGEQASPPGTPPKNQSGPTGMMGAETPRR
jgi:hypothetical protein